VRSSCLPDSDRPQTGKAAFQNVLSFLFFKEGKEDAMTKIQNNDRGTSNFTILIALAVAVILVFVILFIGAYVNATVHESLIDDYPDNLSSGNYDLTYWHNATAGGTNASRNITLATSANQLHGTLTDFYIRANGTHNIYYNLTINDSPTNRTSQLNASGSNAGYNHTLTALIAGSNVSNSDERLYFTWNVNSSESQIRIRVYGSYYVSSDWRSQRQNETYNRMTNISGNWDSGLDIIQVVVIITVLAIAIGAIFLFTRFRG